MNVKMWGSILAGAVIDAIAIVLLVIYGNGFLTKPTAFTFIYGSMDYLGIILAIIGLALIMVGGAFKK